MLHSVAKMLKAWNFKVSYVQTRLHERVHQERSSRYCIQTWQTGRYPRGLAMLDDTGWYHCSNSLWMMGCECEMWMIFKFILFGMWMPTVRNSDSGHCNHQSDNQSFCRFFNCTYIYIYSSPRADRKVIYHYVRRICLFYCSLLKLWPLSPINGMI